MTQVNLKDQRWGLELEFTGVTKERAARALAAYLGGTARNTGSQHQGWYVNAPDGRRWKVMGDSSIITQKNRGGHPAEQCEFVTPICTYDDIPVVQECIRRLRKAGAVVNRSCGLHIHVDAALHTAQSLKNLVFTMKAKQDLIYKAVGTQASRLARWCKPVDDALVDNLKSIAGKKLDRDKLFDTWYSVYGDDWRGRTDHYHASRYHALNLHSTWQRGSIEFRCFEATLHAGEVRACLILCLGMSAQAINSKRASADVLDTKGNDRYAFRCFLLRLGFIGEEFKSVRKHLLKRLDGDSAWRLGRDQANQAA